jgi:hypothetical protein
MATIVRKNLAVNGLIDVWKSFIDSFNSSLITTSKSGNILNITLSGTNIRFEISDMDSNFAYTGIYNGSTKEIGSGIMFSNSSDKFVEVTIAVTDNLFYFGSKDGDGRRNYVLFEKIGNDLFYGASLSQGTGGSFVNIESLTLKNVDTGLTYKHGTILSYSTELGHIDATNADILLSGTSKAFTDTNFITCTAVTSNQVITFNNKNYYSVGTHTLVEMTQS